MKNNKQKETLVSVIIPVFKVEGSLERCVKSVEEQSYKNLEIILVDDGSPDRCPILCDNYAEKNKRIKAIHKKNGGLSSARNEGLNRAKGDYVFFLDSDDYIASDCIMKLLGAAQRWNADIVLGNVKCKSNKSGKEWAYSTAHPDKMECWDEDGFWQNAFSGNTNCIIACNKLYKGGLFKELRFAVGKLNEDELILHKIIKKCKTIVALPDYLYYYCQNEESITHNKDRYLDLSLLEGLLEREEYFEKNKKYSFAQQQMLVIIGNVRFRKLNTEIKEKIRAKLKTLKARPEANGSFRKKATFFLCFPSTYVKIRKIRERIKYGKRG